MKKGQINVGYKPKRVAFDNTTRLVGQAERYSTIPYSSIVAYAAKAAAVPESAIEMAMEAFYDAVNYFVLNGHSVQLPNLGTFSLGIQVKSTVSEAEFTANFSKNLRRIKIRFLPDSELKQMLSSTSNTTFIDDDDFEGSGVIAIKSAYAKVNALLYSLNAGKPYGTAFTAITLNGSRLSKKWIGTITIQFEKADGSLESLQLSEDYVTMSYDTLNIKLKRIFSETGYVGVRKLTVRDVDSNVVLERTFAAIPSDDTMVITAIRVADLPYAEGATVPFKEGQEVEIRLAGINLIAAQEVKVGTTEIEALSAGQTEMVIKYAPTSGNTPIVLIDEDGNEATYNISFGDASSIVVSSITANGMPLNNGGTTNIVPGQSYAIAINGSGLDQILQSDFVLPTGMSINIVSQSATLISANLLNAAAGDLKIVHDGSQIFGAALVATAATVEVTGWKDSANGATRQLSTAVTANTDTGAFSAILVGDNLDNLSLESFNAPATISNLAWNSTTATISGVTSAQGSTVTINILDEETTIGTLRVYRNSASSGDGDGDGD